MFNLVCQRPKTHDYFFYYNIIGHMNSLLMLTWFAGLLCFFFHALPSTCYFWKCIAESWAILLMFLGFAKPTLNTNNVQANRQEDSDMKLCWWTNGLAQGWFESEKKKCSNPTWTELAWTLTRNQRVNNVYVYYFSFFLLPDAKFYSTLLNWRVRSVRCSLGR